MKIYARFYIKGQNKYYAATAHKCEDIDHGIGKVRRFISKKHNIHLSDMINTNYKVK